MHSRNTYNLINNVVNPAYMNPRVVQEAKMCPTEVLAIITRAMETGQDNLKKQAREENQKVADPKMRKALDDLMDACPKFPTAGKDDNNADENRGE